MGLARSPVIYVPGNHEYYGIQSRETIDADWRQLADQHDVASRAASAIPPATGTSSKDRRISIRRALWRSRRGGVIPNGRTSRPRAFRRSRGRRRRNR